jgi:glucosamine 6-phosphate synthetase-like amidotransferase/phosphosugar isomerase protein
MCGITGSSSFDKAWDLYQLNLKRGYFSSGFLAYDEKDNVILKRQKECFEKKQLEEEIATSLSEPIYYLFHSRAPTNSKKPFTEENCHPFNFDSFYVAHNGIITNFKTFPESPEFEVDSSIIPYHLTVHKGNVKKVFEKYEGLFTCWIYDHDFSELKIVKAGSSLHMDEDSFSSIKFDGSHSVDEDGVVFYYDGRCLRQAKELSFKYDNPYDL